MFKEEPNHRNIANILKHGVPHTKRYRKTTPKYVRVFFKDMRNLLSDETTLTIPLEVYRSVAMTESTWSTKKDANNWTVSSVGQTALEDLRSECADSMYAGRWLNKMAYEKYKIILH